MNQLLYPSWTKNYLITLEAKTSDPITEHKIDILDRLDPNMRIGQGGSIQASRQSPDYKQSLKKRTLYGYH